MAYTAGLTAEQFVADTLRYDAALRNLEIMGEAAKRVLAAARELLREADAGMRGTDE